MNLVLFEDHGTRRFQPLVYWRCLFELRISRKIILDRTAQRLQMPVGGVWTRDWIAPVAQQRCAAPANHSLEGPTVLVNGRWMPEGQVDWPAAPAWGRLGEDVAFVVCDSALAAKLSPPVMLDRVALEAQLQGVPEVPADGTMIDQPWDIIARLDSYVAADWELADPGIESELDPRVHIANQGLVHIGHRTAIHPSACIDAGDGPVYISDGVAIGAHCLIEGPCYIGPNTRINPHSWLHGANSIGPVCKLGGEIDGTVFQAYGNKQHAGFLGHALVGSWVNLGASTVNSDLKNTYGTIRVPIGGVEVDSGQMFFGCLIGDHAKTGINTTIPTGAVIGFAATAATSRLLPKFVPSFAWLTDDGMADGDAQRLLDVATKVMARRDVDMTDEEVYLFLDLPNRVREWEQTAT